MNKKRVFFILSLFLFIIGFFILLNSKINITGSFIGITPASLSPSLGVMCFLILGFLCMIEGGLEDLVKNIIKKGSIFGKESEKARRNQYVDKELDHLKDELEKGNLQAGLGRPRHVKGTSVFYLRGRKGARLFYRRAGKGYEIVGEAGKNNETKVRNAIKKFYS